MTHRPFTAPWADAFHAAIAADAAYQLAAAKWAWPVGLVLDATPEFGYPDSVAIELALDHGRCHSVALLPPANLTAPFVLTAPYATWKAVLRGELDPLTGVTLGRIAVRGSLATLMLHARAAKALVTCARAVPIHFPDEA